MRMRGAESGRAGRWLIDDIKHLVASCPEAYRTAEALGEKGSAQGGHLNGEGLTSGPAL